MSRLRRATPSPGSGPLSGTLMGPVSYVSYVSWMHMLNAAETYETVHWESGMRYQIRHSRPADRVSSCPESRPRNPHRNLMGTLLPGLRCACISIPS